MSVHNFGVGRGRVDEDKAERINEIATRHDCNFIWADMPGDGPKYWFEGPDLGAPFAREMEVTVISELERAGLWPPTSGADVD